MTAAVLEKKATLTQLVKSWTVSWTGNLVGSVLLAAMVATAGTLGACTPLNAAACTPLATLRPTRVATLRPAPPQPHCGLHPLNHTAPRTMLDPASTIHTPQPSWDPLTKLLHTPH